MTYNFLSPPNRFKPRELKEFSGGEGGYLHARFQLANSLILGGWVTKVLKNGDKK